MTSKTQRAPTGEAAVNRITSARSLRIAIIVMLVLLTAQGWTGDFANLFATFPTSATTASMSGILQAVQNAGVTVLYHALEGGLLLVISVVIMILSFRSSSLTWVRVFAILGLGATISAGVGGVLFVLSGFQNNPSSAQMGGSFIGAYASYFLALYSAKG